MNTATTNHRVRVPVRNLFAIRASRFLTQSDLAELADVSNVTIRTAEHGKLIGPRTARKLAAALNCTVAELAAEPTAA